MREKLNQRRKTREGYKNVQAILEDIVDLVGVRIGLYFPNHLRLTENIIGTRFQIRRSIDHGESKHVHDNTNNTDYLAQFSGYRGKHFQVSLKAENSNTKVMRMETRKDLKTIMGKDLRTTIPKRTRVSSKSKWYPCCTMPGQK